MGTYRVFCFWSGKFRCLPQWVKMQEKTFAIDNIFLRCNAFFQCSFSQHSSFWRAFPKSANIYAGFETYIALNVHNNGRHDNTIKANEIQPTPWVGARMRRTQMRQNQQLSQALIHRLTRIHPPVKPAGKASTTHMYTSKHILHSLILQSAGTLLPPHPHPPRCNLARQTTSTTNNALLHFGNMSYIAWSYSRQGRYYPPTPTPTPPCNLARQTTTHMYNNAHEAKTQKHWKTAARLGAVAPRTTTKKTREKRRRKRTRQTQALFVSETERRRKKHTRGTTAKRTTRREKQRRKKNDSQKKKNNEKKKKNRKKKTKTKKKKKKKNNNNNNNRDSIARTI